MTRLDEPECPDPQLVLDAHARAKDRPTCVQCGTGVGWPCDPYLLAEALLAALARLARLNQRAEAVRAACATLGHLATGVLAALDGDQALQDPYRRSNDA